MKKSLSFLLSLFLIIALTACGQTGNKGGADRLKIILQGDRI